MLELYEHLQHRKLFTNFQFFGINEADNMQFIQRRNYLLNYSTQLKKLKT